MTDPLQNIRVVDPESYDLNLYNKAFGDCVVLTHDNKILLQYRPENWSSMPGYITTFGGHIEDGETPQDGVIRELNEETGGIINPADLIMLGAITEDFTDHQDIVFVHFWHDKEATITGCYEAEAKTFDTADEIFRQDKIMDYVVWAIDQCRKKDLLP